MSHQRLGASGLLAELSWFETIAAKLRTNSTRGRI